MPIIKVENLTKSYGNLKAVDSVSFEVEEGEIFGMVGPNGAGKTTTLEMIEGLRKIDKGKATIDNINVAKNPQKVKSLIGIQLQSSTFFDRLTLVEILELFASFYQVKINPEEILKKVELLDKKTSFVKTLSGGQQQRFSIAAALVNNPKIVFLDEPTTGLDPQGRRNLWELIMQIKQDGKTIVLTTHFMEEAQLLSDRVAIMDYGKIIALDTPQNLIKTLEAVSSITFGCFDEIDLGELSNLDEVRKVNRFDHNFEIQTKNVQKTLKALTDFTSKKNITIFDMTVEQAKLEDVFLKLTGRRLRE